MNPEIVDADEKEDVRRSNRNHLIALALALVVFGMVPIVLMILDLSPR